MSVRLNHVKKIACPTISLHAFEPAQQKTSNIARYFADTYTYMNIYVYHTFMYFKGMGVCQHNASPRKG